MKHFALLLLLPCLMFVQVFRGGLVLRGNMLVGRGNLFGYVIEGDSISAGNYGHQWSEDIRTNLDGHGVQFRILTNVAISGDTMSNAYFNIGTKVLSKTVPGDKVILFSGTNDENQGITLGDMIGIWTNYCQLVRSNGCKMVGVTLIHRTTFDTIRETKRLAFNLFITNSVSLWCDVAFDAAARFTNGLETGVYEADGTHLNDAGERVFADLLYPLIPK